MERLYEIANQYQKMGLRKGQSLFNALVEMNIDLANKIRGTENDCFYDDKKIKNFIKEIEINSIVF
jgi:hypothetical protein